MFGWIATKLTGRQPAAAPEPDVPLSLSAIDGAWLGGDGLPRPDWAVVRRAIDALPPGVPRPAAWAEAERQWLDELCDALGEPYVWVESGPALVVTWRPADEARPFARLVAGALATVDEVLGPPTADLPGKLVVVALDSADTYYTYVAPFYSDGEHATSGGCCITADDGADGHVHIALIDSGGHGAERVVAHELVHVRLRGHTLPLWVEEGVAEVVSRRVARHGPLLLEPQDVARQQRWWRKRGPGGFWSGRSFGQGNRGQGYSYTLAEVLVQTMVTDHRRNFVRFLADARPDDAGDDAAREHLGMGIAELAGRYLGEGDWAYAPSDNPADGTDPPEPTIPPDETGPPAFRTFS